MRFVGTDNTGALEALAVICSAYPEAAALLAGCLNVDTLAKLLSDIEGVCENAAADPKVALLCLRLLSSLAKVSVENSRSG